MHSHIAIQGPSGPLALKPDTDLTITDKNPMFNDVEMFSQPIQLPFDLNRHILKNMDHVNSAIRPADLNEQKFGIYVDGLPLRQALLKVQEGVNLDGSIDVNFDSFNRTFKDMIADLKCRDIPVDSDILIGEKIGDVHMQMSYQEILRPLVSCSKGYIEGYEIKMKPSSLDDTFQPFALGFSFPGECYENASHEAEQSTTKTYPNPNGGPAITVKVPNVKTSYINVSQPYPTAKYCNSRIAYAHHKVKTENDQPTGETDEEIVEQDERNESIPEDKSPYWVLDAERPTSGICFYVAYFLERLFKYLKVAYDMSALTDISDFNYLAFFTTQCHYDARPKANGTVTLSTEEDVNKWLESRGCGGKVHMNDNRPDGEQCLSAMGIRSLNIAANEFQSWSVINDHGYNNQLVSTDLTGADGSIHIDFNIGGGAASERLVPNSHGSEYYMDVYRSYEISVNAMSAKVMQMFANSENFPDADVSEVIESLENSFGVRFCYDAETNKVTVRLLRDMFRSTQNPVQFKGVVTKIVPRTEIIKGVRMLYSQESEAREQQENIKTGKRDYDTVYDYMDYPQEYTKIATFEDVTEKIDVGNRNGYCDLRNGNFYRIKVSSDANTVSELRPAVFEVGAMKGVELGDCSEQADKDGQIKEFVSKFIPIIVNDVAFAGKNGAYQDPMLVPFIDEDMEHEFLIKKILNPISTKWGSVDVTYELCLAECYDPTKTDDGQSPLQHHDWGLTIGFLRPATNSGGSANYNQNYDGFGNAKWLVNSKNYAITSDSFDEHANFLGTDAATSFSLKPRAYKPFRYKFVNTNLVISTNPKEWDNTWLIPCNEDTRDGQGFITQRLRSRGTCDTFMIDFFHFLLNRKLYYIEAICTAAELADIPNKWLRKFVIDGMVGWINTITYPVKATDGLGKVEIEFFAL